MWGTVHEGRVLSVKRTAGTQTGLGPMMDRRAIAASFAAAAHDHGHEHGGGDVCTTAKRLAEAALSSLEKK